MAQNEQTRIIQCLSITYQHLLTTQSNLIAGKIHPDTNVSIVNSYYCYLL